MREYIKTQISDFTIRFADEEDVKLILEFIQGLAEYEKMSDLVKATEEILFDSLFVKHQAEVIIAEYQGVPVGFALFYHNFSTFLGKANLYLEDLFIKPQFRGMGFGKILFSYLGRICEERNCARLDWWCLDWNKPSIEFYKKMGAIPMDDWTVYRIEGDRIHHLSSQF